MMFLVDQEAMKENACQMPISFLHVRRDLDKDNCHSLVPTSEKEWYSISEDSPQGQWDHVAERMLVELAEWLARGMGSPRHGIIRRRQTREGPEPACVRSPTLRGGTCRERRMN